MKKYRIKGLWLTVEAETMRDAVRQLVEPNLNCKIRIIYASEGKYEAQVRTHYGYECVVEEI